MAYYNANRMIKLNREALDIVQEELCADICDVSTLSKIENGHYGVKRDTYNELMKKMGRVTEMRYVVCLEQDGIVLEERCEMERAFKKRDYAAAEKFFLRMKEEADDNILTKQYLARAEALIQYYQNRISPEEMLERVGSALRMTVPDYEKYVTQQKVFPFVREELLTLMSLGEAYCKVGKKEQGMQYYELCYKCVNAGYLGEPDKTSMGVLIEESMLQAYAAEGKHEAALEKIEACLKICREKEYGHLMPVFLFYKAHSYIRLVERGEWDDEKMSNAKMLLRQSYKLATARGEHSIMEKIMEYCKQHFGEDRT